MEIMIKKSSRLFGLLLIMLSISVAGVSAYIYQEATQTITQTILEVATITLKNSDLGNLKEGETKAYTSGTVPNLGDAITITTQEANVYLHLDSDLDALTTHSSYSIVVKFSQVVGATYSIGDTACTLTIGSPDYSAIDLDAAGTWAFDFEIDTSVGSVDADDATTVTIIVSGESTT